MTTQILPYNSQFKSSVIELHKIGLIQENAYISDSALDADLEDIENHYQQKGHFLIAVSDNTLLGMGAIRFMSSEVAEIKRMRVIKNFQGRGIGQLLYDNLERIALQKGFRSLVLDTTSNQNTAQNFYMKNGFVEMKREHSQELNAYIIFYQKRLS